MPNLPLQGYLSPPSLLSFSLHPSLFLPTILFLIFSPSLTSLFLPRYLLLSPSFSQPSFPYIFLILSSSNLIPPLTSFPYHSILPLSVFLNVMMPNTYYYGRKNPYFSIMFLPSPSLSLFSPSLSFPSLSSLLFIPFSLPPISFHLFPALSSLSPSISPSHEPLNRVY